MKKYIRRNLIDEHIVKSQGILHVGAHRGQEASKYYSMKKSVFWVEAMPNTYQQLIENIKIYENQRAVCALVSSEDEKVYNFNISNNMEGVSSSIFKFGSFSNGDASLWPELNLTMVNTIELKSKKIDTLINENSLDVTQYDFWVIDVQGAELLALQGAEQSISKCNFILAEVSQGEVYQNGVLYPELKNFLMSKGFVPAYEPKKIHDDVLFLRTK